MGWEKEKPTGEKMTSPFAYSTAEVTYTKGDSRIRLKMADSGFNQLFFAPFTMAMQAGYEKETSDGYEKSAQAKGRRWNQGIGPNHALFEIALGNPQGAARSGAEAVESLASELANNTSFFRRAVAEASGTKGAEQGTGHSPDLAQPRSCGEVTDE